MRYIDIHTHVISTVTSEYPLAPLGGKQSTWSAERPTSGDELLTAMDDAGVEKAAVVQASTAYSFDNSYAADSVELASDRLAGVCSVDFLADDAAERLEYWVKERGFVGVRLFSTGSTLPTQGEWLDDPRTRPAWEWCEENELPVCVQMQSTGIPQLERILANFPRLTVVLDHAARPNLAGGPPYPHAEPLFALTRHERIYLKISSNTFLRAEKEAGGPNGLMRALRDHFTARRMAWGSNFPATKGSLPELRAYAEKQLDGFSDNEKAEFFAGTATRIYPALA
jgi:predicted TIM-barrel fold metal-dependent hydrolase